MKRDQAEDFRLKSKRSQGIRDKIPEHFEKDKRQNSKRWKNKHENE